MQEIVDWSGYSVAQQKAVLWRIALAQGLAHIPLGSAPTDDSKVPPDRSSIKPTHHPFTKYEQ